MNSRYIEKFFQTGKRPLGLLGLFVVFIFYLTLSGQAQAAISGTVYADGGSANIGSGKTVRLIKNGADAGTAVTNASGQYSITPASLTAGDALLVYIDNDATYKGNTVTVTNGAAISGLDIYAAHLITRQDNGGSLSNANLSTAVGVYSDASDILYSVATNNLAVSGSGWTLYIPASQSYTPGGNITTPNMTSIGTFNGGSGSITVNGAFTQSGGVFTATSGSLNIATNITISAGTFNHNAGTVNFNSGNNGIINAGSAVFNNVIINRSGAFTTTITGTLDVDGNLSIVNFYNLNGGVIAVAGNVTTTNVNAVSGSATILFDGGGNQTLSAAGASGQITGVSINKSGGTLTVQDTIVITGSSGWTYTQGTVDTGSSTVQFLGNNTINISATGMSFNHVVLNKAGINSITVTGTMDVNGNLTISAADTINTGTIQVAGNLTTTDGDGIAGSGVILFDGAGNQSLSASGGTGSLPNVAINKASGTLTISDTILVGGSVGWTHTAGTVDVGSSTVKFTTNVSITIDAPGMAFNHVELNKPGFGVNVTVPSSLDINGNLTITAVSGLGGAISIAGNLTSADTSVGGTGAITLDGTGAQTINTTGGTDLPNGNITINKASGTATLASNLTLNSAGQDLTITSGTLDLAGYNLVLTGAGDVLTVGNGATLQLQGGETVTASTKTFNAGSTVIYNGGSTYSSLNLGNSYSNLAFNNATGSWTHTGTLTAKDLTITAGALLSGGQNVNVSGNWSNSGTYTPGANTITLNGANQTITGNTAFNNFTKSVASTQTLTFAAGTTTTINGTVTINGASGQLLSLVSSSPGTRWNFTLGAASTKAISYVNVTDSDASGSDAAKKPVLPANSTDSGNNIAWFQAVISGIVYTDQGVTNIGSGKTVRLIVNGSSAGTTTTDASGAYSINASFTAGDALLAYIDNDATYKGNTVTISNGSSLSGLDIYAAHLITRQDNGGSLSNANLSTAKGGYSDASDILYSVTASNLTVSGSNWTLYIPSGQSYAPGGNVTTPSMKSVGTFAGGTGTITVQGNLVISGGSYTATSGTTAISSFFTISGGSFLHNSGMISFGTTGWRQANTGAASLNNVTLNYSTSQLDVIGTMNVSGNLTITTAGTLGSGTIAVAGNVTTTDSDVDGAGTITFNGTGAQTLSASGGTGALPGVIINKASGTLTIQDTINVDGTGGWTHTAGSVDASASTIVFTGTGKTVNAAGMSFNQVTVNMNSGATLTVTGTMDVNGNLTLTQMGALSGGTLAVAGNVTSTDTIVDGTAVILFDGSGAQTIDTTGGGDLPNGMLTINKASGTATLASNLTLNSAGQDLTVTAGTLDLAGYNLALTAAGDVLTVGVNGTLKLQGGETVTVSTKTFSTGSTVYYYGSGFYSPLVLGNSYHHLTFSSNLGTFVQSAPLTVAGNLTIDADFNSAGQNITVAGNWIKTGAAYTAGANTVTFNGANQSITGNTTFNNFTKSVAAADTLTFAAGSTTSIIGLATLNGAAGQLLSLRSSSTPTRWNINLFGTKSTSYVDVKDSDASGSIAGNKPVAPTNSTNSGNNIDWFATPTVVKSVTVISDPFNNTTNPKAIPGAIVEYTITIANGAGASTATNIVVTDSLNANITAGTLAFNPNTYAAGQGIQVTAPNINGGAAKNLTNSSDADEGDFNVTGTNTVTVSDIALTAGQSATVKFRVTVQ